MSCLVARGYWICTPLRSGVHDKTLHHYLCRISNTPHIVLAPTANQKMRVATTGHATGTRGGTECERGPTRAAASAVYSRRQCSYAHAYAVRALKRAQLRKQRHCPDSNAPKTSIINARRRRKWQPFCVQRHIACATVSTIQFESDRTASIWAGGTRVPKGSKLLCSCSRR